MNYKEVIESLNDIYRIILDEYIQRNKEFYDKLSKSKDIYKQNFNPCMNFKNAMNNIEEAIYQLRLQQKFFDEHEKD